MTEKNSRVELQGSIREFNLSDIVQFLSGSNKTGRLVLTELGGRSGSIVFDAGSIVHAEIDDRSGEEAFFELMRWTQGGFAFEPDVKTEVESVRLSGTSLLIEGARRSDEWDILKEKIPDLTWVPEFIAPAEDQTGKQIMLNTSEWIVLSKIDGERSVRELAASSNLSEYHTCRLLYPLISNRLIRLREPSP